MSVCGCVCLWSVFPWYQLLVSFTICQKGIADLSNSWLVPLPRPAQALWPSIQRVSKGVGKMFCIFSILVFQSPLVGVGSSYLVISLYCLGQLPSWITRTSLVRETEQGLLLPRLSGAAQHLRHGGLVLWRMPLHKGKREDGFRNCYWRALWKFLLFKCLYAASKAVEYHWKLCWNEQGRVPIYCYLRILMIQPLCYGQGHLSLLLFSEPVRFEMKGLARVCLPLGRKQN